MKKYFVLGPWFLLPSRMCGGHAHQMLILVANAKVLLCWAFETHNGDAPSDLLLVSNSLHL